MDTLTLLVTAANLDPTHALELTYQASNGFKHRKYIVGHCGRAFNLEERIRDSTQWHDDPMVAAEVVYYSLGFRGSHSCLVCNRPHGLGEFAKYNPEVKTVLTPENSL